MAIPMKDGLIFFLFSGSPRRKAMLENLKLGPVYVRPSNIIEKRLEHESAKEYVARNSELKLNQGMAQNTPEWKAHQGPVLAIGADTVVANGSAIFEKPDDRASAFHMLHSLSESQHQVWSGVTCQVWQNGILEKKIQFAVKTDVKFIKLSESMIDHYLSLNEWQDKAGGYGIQGFAGNFVDGIEGSYSNVVGFPMAQFIANCDVDLFQKDGR